MEGNKEEEKEKCGELSERSVGRRWVRWQESGTATQLCFWRRGTPEIGVTLFYCQGEERGRERNARDGVMYREKEREEKDWGEAEKK